MLSGGFNEALQNSITMSEMPTATLRAFLHFLYTDSVSEELLMDNQIAVNLIEIGEAYLLLSLKTVCEKIIIKNGIEIESALDMLHFAVVYKAKVRINGSFISLDLGKIL